MKKAARWILAAALVGAVGMQFFNPKLTNPAVGPGDDLMASNAPPPAIATMLHEACYDCHSYETRWPWYGHVAPASWFLSGHVNDAREAMNFSDWPNDDADSARNYLNHIVHQVQSGKMPLRSYTWMHPAARLTDAQRKKLTDWAAKTAAGLK
jgi:hypothetical protein